MKKLGSSAEAVADVLRQIKMSPQVAAAFAKSKGAMSMLLGGIKTGGIAAGEYAAIVGAKALPLLKVGGKGLVGLDAAIAMYELHANQMRINGTENESLKDFYKAQDNVYLTRGVAGTALGVTAMTTTTGGLATTGAFTLSGTAATSGFLFPVAFIAIGAGSYSADKINAETERWLKSDKDFAKQTTGDLLREFHQIAPGKHSYWQGAASGTRAENWARWVMDLGGDDYKKWEENNWQTIEGANARSRYLIMKAYLSQMTDLPQNQGELQSEYDARFASFQMDQMNYFMNTVGKDVGPTYTHVYESAHAHAELMALSRELKANGESQMVTIQGLSDGKGGDMDKDFDIANYADFKGTQDSIDGITAGYVIHAYKEQKKEIALVQSNVLRELSPDNPSLKVQRKLLMQKEILMGARHMLPMVERKILESDFDGIFWNESEGENIARYTLYKKVRSTLDAESAKLLLMQDPTVEQLDDSIDVLKGMIQSADPVSLQSEGKKAGYAAAVEKHEASAPMITDYRWIMGQIVSEA